MAYPARANSQKYTASTFPGFDYSAHVNVRGYTVVLSDVKFAAGIQESV